MPPTQPERGKSKRYYRMRANLVDVAAGLFAKNGYASTGVAEIGDATGLARGAVDQAAAEPELERGRAALTSSRVLYQSVKEN
jgi:Bacterial regulatory proteins, tetR family